MRLLACLNSAARDRFSAQKTLPLALLLSFLVVGLDQFLQTAPAQFSASPLLQLLRWLSDGLMAFPLFAVGVWTGHRAADRLRLAVDSRADCVQRALLIAAALAVVLIPGWFAYNALANATGGANFSSGHEHGGAAGTITKYWVSGSTVYALLLAPLVVAVLLAAYQMAARVRFRLPAAADRLARGSLIAVLAAGVPTLAWFLHQAANRAASSQVYNTASVQLVHIHSHQFFAADKGAHLPPPGPPVTAAPFAFAYQVARAFEDAVVGQLIALPVLVLVLLWAARGLREQTISKKEGSYQEEVAER
jgi:hypothetical protein